MKLVLLELGRIGDTVVTLPATKSIREAFPDAEIIRICSPAAKPLLKGSPYMDRLLVYDRDGEDRRGKAGMELLRSVRATKPDIFVNLHVPDVNRTVRFYFRDNLFSFLTGAHVRVGYYCRGTGVFLTHGIKAKSSHLTTYIGDLIDDLAVQLRCRPSGHVGLWIGEQDRNDAIAFLRSHGVQRGRRLVAIHPGAKRPSRRWPLSGFVEIARWAGEEARVVITGSTEELDLARQISDGFPDAIIASGALSIMQTAAILERSSLFITNDTGIMHVALALGVPTIALFGPGNVRRWVPSDASWIKVLHHPVSCSPCYRWQCADLTCMRAISVDEVKKAGQELIT